MLKPLLTGIMVSAMLATATLSAAQSVQSVVNTTESFTYIHRSDDPHRPGSLLASKSPAQTLADNGGDCIDMATYFTVAMSALGFNTERVAEKVTMPKSGTNGHVIGIATDGLTVWRSSNDVITIFNSVEDAVAEGGQETLPPGTVISNRVVYGGNYIPNQLLKYDGQ